MEKSQWGYYNFSKLFKFMGDQSIPWLFLTTLFFLGNPRNQKSKNDVFDHLRWRVGRVWQIKRKFKIEIGILVSFQSSRSNCN